MPRKKLTNDQPALVDEPTTSPESTAEEPKAEPKKRTSRRPAKKAEPEVAPEVVAADAPEAEKPKATRSRARKEPAEPQPELQQEPEQAPEPARDPKAEEKTSRRSRSRKKPESAADPVDTAEAGDTESKAEETKEKPRRGRTKSKPAPEPATPAASAEDADDLQALLAEFDIPGLSWRPLNKPAAPEPKRAAAVGADQGTDEPEEAAAEGQLAPRKSRRRRRKDRPDEPITAAAAVEPVSSEPTEAADERPPTARRGRESRGRDSGSRENGDRANGARENGRRRGKPEPQAPVQPVQQEPAPPPRPLIEIPDDAPQIVLRHGIPTLVRDQRVYPPISFFGSSPDEARAKNVLEELRMAGEAGVHIHSHLVEFEVDPRNVDGATSFAAYMLKKSVEADPQAQVIFRVVFIAPAGWTDRYPAAKYLTEDGALAEPSVCDRAFWDDAKSCLTQFIKSLRLLDLKDHILGVHLERGEWFFAQGLGYDTSRAAKDEFREWARTRYREDVVALRAAWFDGAADFNTLSIPPYQAEEEGAEKFVRSSRKERRWVDYHLFLSDATVNLIGDLAYVVKEASEGYFLAGVSYGYTFEWSHPASGHLSLGKLLRTPEIDFIAGPPSYRTREPGGAASFPCPIDSLTLNGKLYISEEDFKTSIGGRQEPDDFNPVIKTPQALESIHWRGLGAALAHASGVCWMDLWGNGWLRTQSIWDRAAKARELLIHRMAAPHAEPDVAVFIDERALAYLVDQKAFALLVQNVRESVLRAGLSASFYLLSDLQHREKFPESKLYVFLNAWDIRPELRAAIKTRLQRDNKVLFWLYAAGLFDSGRESLERAREVTGIALKPQPYHSRSGTTVLNRRHPLGEALPDRPLIGGFKLEPSYFAIPEEAVLLAEYSQTGLPSFVMREFRYEDNPSMNWKSVFLGEPLVTPALMRALGHLAGAHVWDYQDDVVHVRPPFLTVHCTGTGHRTITLPNKWSAFNLVTGQWMATEATSLRFHAVDGSTHVFLVGIKEELEQILSADPEDLLRLEELPAKPENTIRFDTFTFDVPIMKLDEWIEGGDAEEMADDLLFRPRLVEEPEQESEKLGKRRRRSRRRDRDARGDVEPSRERETVFEEDLGMNVVFRKRD